MVRPHQGSPLPHLAALAGHAKDDVYCGPLHRQRRRRAGTLELPAVEAVRLLRPLRQALGGAKGGGGGKGGLQRGEGWAGALWGHCGMLPLASGLV